MPQENMIQILLLILVVVGGYFLLVRPAKKKQQEAQQLLSAIEPGDRVMTSIGIYGEVKHLGDFQAILEIAPGVEVTIAKQIIAKKAPLADDEFEYADEPKAETPDLSTPTDFSAPSETAPALPTDPTEGKKA